MNFLRFALPCAAASLVFGCATSSNNLLIDDQSRCPQRLEVGQTLTLSLPSNPSTGYRWEVVNAAPEILRSLGPEVFNPGSQGQIVGAPGNSVWRFTAQHTGNGELQLAYKRPWENEIAEQFQCNLSVR